MQRRGGEPLNRRLQRLFSIIPVPVLLVALIAVIFIVVLLSVAYYSPDTFLELFR